MVLLVEDPYNCVCRKRPYDIYDIVPMSKDWRDHSLKCTCYTIQLLRKKIGENPCDCDKDFLNRTPYLRGRSIKAYLIDWISSKFKTSTL